MAEQQADLPTDLRACPPAALEDYVQSRVRQFNSQPQLEQWLGPQAAATLRQATEHLLSGGATGGNPSRGEQSGGRSTASRPPQPTLVFRHDCRHLGCADSHCQLCAQNPSRRCPRTFCPKYLAGDALKAACGAPIRVELIDAATGRLIADHSPIQLQVCVVEGKAYEALACAEVAPTDADLDRVTLLLNQQGQPLLTAKQAGTDTHSRVLLPLSKGCVMLPDLSITGSSEALLSGQRPPFALLLRALDGSGERRIDVPPAASEGFVVATPRVRSATKRAIPKLSDHVSKLTAVGAATQAKLRDLNKAAVEAGVHGLELPLSFATTVGEFRLLVEWAQEDAARLDTIKKMLKLTRGWEEARDHALRAVGDDCRLRAFFTDDSLASGLLFACKEAAPQLDAPLAVLRSLRDEGSGQRSLQATLLPKEGDGQALQQDGSAREGGEEQGWQQACAVDRRQVQIMLQQAKACWARRGHPGWALLPLDTPAFEAAYSHLHQVLLPQEVAAAAIPQAPHTSASFPNPSSLTPPSPRGGVLAGTTLQGTTFPAGSSLSPQPTTTATAASFVPSAGGFAGGMASLPQQQPVRFHPLQQQQAVLPGMGPLDAMLGSPSPISMAGAVAGGGAASPLPSGSSPGTPREASEMVQEFASLGVQSPLTPWPAGQPPHALANSPFDAMLGPPVPPQPLPGSAAEAAMPGAAGRAAVPGSSGSLAERLMRSIHPAGHQPQLPHVAQLQVQQVQQQALPRFVPVQPQQTPTQAAVAGMGTQGSGGSGGSGGAVPLHLQLESSGQLQLRSSGESKSSGVPSECTAGLAQEISLTPPLAVHGASMPVVPPEVGQLAPGATAPAVGQLAPGTAMPGVAQPSGQPSPQLARILSDLPPLGLFAPGGPLSLGAIAELDASAPEGGGEGISALAGTTSMQCLCDLFGGGGKEPTVDWEQLLRDAYKPYHPPGQPLTAGPDGAADGLTTAPTGELVETAALLRMLSNASLAAQELARLGTFGDLEGMLGDPPPALQGDQQQQQQQQQAGAAPSGGSDAMPAQKRQMLRNMTPQWTKLLSLSTADWATLLQQPARGSPTPPGLAAGGAHPAPAATAAPPATPAATAMAGAMAGGGSTAALTPTSISTAPESAAGEGASSAAAAQPDAPEGPGTSILGRKRQLSFRPT